MKLVKITAIFAIVFLMFFSSINALGGVGFRNLITNGSFDDKNNPLNGWRYKYDLPGESFYFGNHLRVSVVKKEGGRKQVLRLDGSGGICGTQGVKVDSKPIPYEKGKKYKITMYKRSMGPKSRIYIIGYKWLPGIKPHENPEFHELRNIYKGRLVYPWNNTSKRWKKGTGIFPGKDLSKQAKKHLKKIKFISLHIVAIGGGDGDLFIDDVMLEKIR